MTWQGCWIANLLVGWVVLSAGTCWGDADQEFAQAAADYRASRWEEAKLKFGQFQRRYARDERAADALFFQAESAIQAGSRAEAVPLYQQLLADYPQHAQRPTAEFRVAEAAYLQGNDPLAQQGLEAFVQNHRTHFLACYAWPYLGDIAWNAQQYPRAEQCYTTAIREFPEGWLKGKCLCQLGMLHFREGRWTEAQKYLQDFATNYRDDPLIRQGTYWLARTELELGNFPEAARLLAPLAQSAPSRTANTPAAEREQEAAIAYFTGRAFRLNKELPEAAQWYASVETQWPDSPRAEDAAYDQWLMLPTQDQASAAERFLERYPSSTRGADMKRIIAQAYLEQQRYPQAEQVIGPVVRQSGLQPDPLDLYLLASAQVGQKNYQGALATLDLHSQSWSADLAPAILLIQGHCHYALGEYQRAVGTFNDYLARYADRPEAARVQQDLASAMAQLGNTRSAIETAATHTSHLPSNQSANTQLKIAQDAYDQQNYADAALAFQAVLDNPSVTPEDQMLAQLGLGLSQIAQQAWQPAATALEQLLATRPSNRVLLLEAYRGLGKAYSELDQLDKSADNYQKLLKLDARAKGADVAHLEIARWHESRKKEWLTLANKQSEALQEYQEAVRHLAVIQTDFPQSSELHAALYLWAWLEKDQRNDKKAIELFGELATHHDASDYWDDAVYRLSEYLVNEKKFREAEQLLANVIEKGHDEGIIPYARYLQGQVFAGLGRWSEMPELLKPLINQPTIPALVKPARFWTAEAYYRTNQFNWAETEFRDLWDEAQEETAKWVPMIPLRIAQIMVQPERLADPNQAQVWEQALQYAELISEKYPDFAQQFEVDYLRGRCHMMLADPNAARLAFQKALAATPAQGTETQAMADCMIGETHLQQKQFNKARSHFLAIVPKYRDYPQWRASALMGAGLAAEQLNQPQEAVGYYRRIRSEFPTASAAVVAKAEDRLKQLEGARSASRPAAGRVQ